MFGSKETSRRGVGVALVLAAGMSLLLGASPAAADTSGGGDEGSAVDRVIDRTDDTMPVLNQSARSFSANTEEVPGVIPLPDGVTLSVGETVQVNYSDGVAVHEAITLACTTTGTVGNPYKSGNSVTAKHTYGMNSSCGGGNQQIEGKLDSFASPFWHTRSSVLQLVRPGFTTTWFTSKSCVNSTNTAWKAFTIAQTTSGSTPVATSPQVTLACNPG